MRKFAIVAATGSLLLGSVTLALAAERGTTGASGATPGHEMQEFGSKPGQPGASGYAPGHRDRDGTGLKSDGDQRMARDDDRDRDMKFKMDRDDNVRDRVRDRDDRGFTRDRDDRMRDMDDDR